MRVIRRDPFARTELLRFIVPTKDETCDNCGGQRYKEGKPIPSLYSYMTVQDGGGRYIHKGKFCCLPCHNSYHG